MNKEAFVYLWYDSRSKMFYLGKHKGTPDDGYTHSSCRWEQFSSNSVPKGVRRRVLTYGSNKDMYKLENELLRNRKEKCWDRYYNESINGELYIEWTEERKQEQSEIAKRHMSVEYIGRTGHCRYIGECLIIFQTDEKKIKILDGKEVVCYKTLKVDNLTYFCRENNYNVGRVHALIIGYISYKAKQKAVLLSGETRIYKKRRSVYKAKIHKDIVKVILLDEEKNKEAQIRIKKMEEIYKEETKSYNNISEEEKERKKLNASKGQKLLWLKLSKEKKQKRINAIRKTAKKNCKPILCTLSEPTGNPRASNTKFIETGKKIKFKSVQDAKKFGYNIGTISAVGLGKRRSVGGDLGIITKVEYL